MEVLMRFLYHFVFCVSEPFSHSKADAGTRATSSQPIFPFIRALEMICFLCVPAEAHLVLLALDYSPQ
jgi:hypothetical protein